jgi:peptidoglycan/LPS O-acetylase OafA/YrhL
MLFLSGPTTEKVCGAIIVCKLYYFDCGALGAFLGRQASVYVGRISYSFYLFNVPILGWLTFELQKTPLALSHPLEIGIAASVMVVAATLVVAHLSTNLIELPVATFSSLLGRRQAAVDAKAR